MKFRLLKDLPFAKAGQIITIFDKSKENRDPLDIEGLLIEDLINKGCTDWLEPIEEEKKPKRWRAEKGSKYVYLNDLWICSVEIEENDEVDDLRFQMHSYFKSREECGIYKEVLEIESELRGLADWNEDSPIKWQICFTGSGLRVYNETIYDGRAISFQTEESAQKAIDQIGESRLIKYLTYKF